MNFTHVPDGDYMTSDDYAKATGLSPATARRHAVNGKVDAVKVGRAWLIRKSWKLTSAASAMLAANPGARASTAMSDQTRKGGSQ